MVMGRLWPAPGKSLIKRRFRVFAMASGAVLRRLTGALVLGLAEAAVVLSLAAVLTAPASAQNRPFDDRFPFLEERNRRGGGGGGGGWGGGGWGGGGFFGNNEQRPAAPVVENNS